MKRAYLTLASLAVGLALGFTPQPYTTATAAPRAATTARPVPHSATSRDFLRSPLVPLAQPVASSLPTASVTTPDSGAWKVARPVVRPVAPVTVADQTPAVVEPHTGRAETGDAVFWRGAPILKWCESRDNYKDKYNAKYRGGYQIGYREWQVDLGYTGDPADASPALQDLGALRLWRARGWAPWHSSSSCSHLR